MKKYIFIFITLVTFMSTLQAQTTNPFDLIDGKEKSNSIDQGKRQNQSNVISTRTEEESQETTISNNPFELNLDKKTGNKNTGTPEPASLNDESNSVQPITNTNATNEVDNNPFSLQKQTNESTMPTNSEVSSTITEELDTPVSNNNNKPKSNVFVFWISILSGLILSILLTINRGIIVKIWKGIKNNNFMILFQKEERNGTSISFGLLYLCFLLNLSAFITLYVQKNGYDFLNQSFVRILLFVWSLLLLRHIIMFVMRQISNAKKEINNYYFSIISINSLLGIVLIPVNLLIAFGPAYTQSQVVILGILILIGCLVLRWIKGIINSLRLIFNASFHFFLYLCTAEMLPLLIGIRIYLNLM